MRKGQFICVLLLFFAAGCETVHKATSAAGEAGGRGAAAIGGITEGAAEGYKGRDVTADNPYGR